MKTVIDNEELKKIMCANIMLAGGTSMMPGLARRIKNELTDFREGLIVSGDSQRYISAWIGASMISSMSTFNQILISRAMYMDSGEDRIAIFKRVL